MQKISIGTLIKSYRISLNITIAKLCKGLCSKATLSKIENNTQEANVFLIESLLQRLGLSIQKFENILNTKEYELYTNRLKLQYLIRQSSDKDIFILLESYKKQIAKDDILQIQFLKMMEGFSQKDPLIAYSVLESAIRLTISDFEASNLESSLLTSIELQIISEITNNLMKMNQREKGRRLRKVLIDYLETNPVDEKEKVKLYPSLFYHSASDAYENKNYKGSICFCEKGIQLYKNQGTNDNIGELYFLLAKSLKQKRKAQGYQLSEKEREQCFEYCIKGACIFSSQKNEEKLKELKYYLKKEYQWESTV